MENVQNVKIGNKFNSRRPLDVLKSNFFRHTYKSFKIGKHFFDIFFEIDIRNHGILSEYQVTNFQSFQCNQVVDRSNLKIKISAI